MDQIHIIPANAVSPSGRNVHNDFVHGLLFRFEELHDRRWIRIRQRKALIVRQSLGLLEKDLLPHRSARVEVACQGILHPYFSRHDYSWWISCDDYSWRISCDWSKSDWSMSNKWKDVWCQKV